jgi:cellulose synthase/poly-beta-1,6-N-acetylglucosamine synthase-like glycosyltransferase
MLTITTLVPTYRRIEDLTRCLDALQQQTRPAEEVVLVVRDIDRATWDFLQGFPADRLPLRVVTATLPGQVAALNAGLAAAQGDIIAITDDDATPHSDWLARIATHFQADDHLGGVGGRDWVYVNGTLYDGAAQQVGLLQWFGRTIGNHHIGTGPAREVDILKGANMSFRRKAIADLHFDDRLWGSGAQVHNDLAFCLGLKRAGWRLIYDPQVAVNHYPAQRFDEDGRGKFNPIALINNAHNETLVLLDHLSPLQRGVFLVWAVLVGNRVTLGGLQILRMLPQEGVVALQKGWASLQGRWQGWRTWQKTFPC